MSIIILTELGDMHSAIPEWKGLTEGFQNRINKGGFATTYKSFGDFANFVGNGFLMQFLRDRNSTLSEKLPNKKASEGLPGWEKSWQGSALQESVVTTMLDKIFKHTNLYQDYPLMYFMFQHVAVDLQIDSKWNFGIERNRTRRELSSAFSNEHADMLDFLSANVQAMYSPSDLGSMESKKTIFPEFFIEHQGNTDEINSRMDFLTKTREGTMLRVFKFVNWFETIDISSANSENLRMILDACSDIRRTGGYGKYYDNSRAYAEEVYKGN